MQLLITRLSRVAPAPHTPWPPAAFAAPAAAHWRGLYPFGPVSPPPHFAPAIDRTRPRVRPTAPRATATPLFTMCPRRGKSLSCTGPSPALRPLMSPPQKSARCAPRRPTHLWRHQVAARGVPPSLFSARRHPRPHPTATAPSPCASAPPTPTRPTTTPPQRACRRPPAPPPAPPLSAIDVHARPGLAPGAPGVSRKPLPEAARPDGGAAAPRVGPSSLRQWCRRGLTCAAAACTPHQLFYLCSYTPRCSSCLAQT